MTSRSSAPGRPALPTAVYAASEGLSVLVLDCRAFGGQAGASARIENYLGFPTGITGMALMARAYNQAQKFGVEMAIPDEVAGLAGDGRFGRRDASSLSCPTTSACSARSVVIASGARYRRLDVANLERFRGLERALLGLAPRRRSCAPGRRWRSWAPAIPRARRRSTWRARQPRSGCWCAAPILRRACRAISSTASRGLANVEVLTRTSVTGLEGRDGMLEAIRWRRGASGEEVGGRSSICSSSSAPSRTPIGLRNPALRWMQKGSS